MNKFIDIILPYLTLDNFIQIVIVLVILVIVLFLMKQILKILALVVILVVAYYYFLASPEIKIKIDTCVVKSMDSKFLDKSCKNII